jgi:hypothetical protein
MPLTRWSRSVLFCSLTLLLVSVTSAADCLARNLESAEQRTRILDGADYQGGLIVHLGCGDGRLTAALGAADQRWFRVWIPTQRWSPRLESISASWDDTGEYPLGAFDGKQLPYADNLVNLVVVSGGGSQVSDEEIQRVLCPGGVAWYESDDRTSKGRSSASDGGTG